MTQVMNNMAIGLRNMALQSDFMAQATHNMAQTRHLLALEQILGFCQGRSAIHVRAKSGRLPCVYHVPSNI